MSDSENNETLDDLEELEELDDLDELDDQSDEEELSYEEIAQYYSPTNPYTHSIFPVLFINKKLKILFSNPASEQMLEVHKNLEGQYLTDLFGKFFDLQDIRIIRETVLQGINGFCWKGLIHIKSHEQASTQTKIYLFPLSIVSDNPSEFVVLLDDVTKENMGLLRRVFMSLLEASRLKDNDTGKHISRVNSYSKRLAEELFDKKGYERIDADFIDNIGYLASMHDVGKIGTPDDILNKEGPLSEPEWTSMQEHTKNGAFILSTYPHPMAKEIALSHHERWNGTGYPFMLDGDTIPLAARIVSIADVYDALRMQRSYKPAIPHKKTVEKIMESKNTQFDPSLIDIFYKITDDFNDIFENNRDS